MRVVLPALQRIFQMQCSVIVINTFQFLTGGMTIAELSASADQSAYIKRVDGNDHLLGQTSELLLAAQLQLFGQADITPVIFAAHISQQTAAATN